MASAGPFSGYKEAVGASSDICLSQDSMTIISSGTIASYHHKWSKGEQSTALATATDSTLQELYEWNARYRQKFGFVFFIFASGRSSSEILTEMKRLYQNRPIVELELAAKEQMKITELRISKLFSANATAASTTNTQYASDVIKARGFIISFCLFMF